MSDEHFLVPLSLVTRLLDRQDDLIDRLQEMIGQIHHHQVRQFAPTDPLPPIAQRDVSYMTEEEQDLRFQHDIGNLDTAQLESALRDMDFQNAEIDII